MSLNEKMGYDQKILTLSATISEEFISISISELITISEELITNHVNYPYLKTDYFCKINCCEQEWRFIDHPLESTGRREKNYIIYFLSAAIQSQEKKNVK